MAFRIRRSIVLFALVCSSWGLGCKRSEQRAHGAQQSSAADTPAAQRGRALSTTDDKLHPEQVKLPPGFSLGVFAAQLEKPRSLAMSTRGTIFVGSRDPGKVIAIADLNQDGRYDRVYEVAQGLNSPNGVAFQAGALYVAEINRILRFDKIEEQLERPPAPHVIYDKYPDDKHHGWKFIGFGPDGLLYVPVGAPCNVCERSDPRYAALTRMQPDGSNVQVFARGIRNTVGFAFHPETHELWFTDNGRDSLGDDVPPDELNRAPQAGLHFGFPHCHGTAISDPEFGKLHACSEFAPPERELGPHVAALGMRFYTGKMFPPEYQHQIFIAEHGSWNRSKKIGYRVTLVRLAAGKAQSYETFAEGFLDAQGKAWGRPVDVLVMRDGSLLVSDDEGNAIYRISYAAH